MHLTIDTLRTKGARQALTPLSGLAQVEDGLYPKGFIFHMSRCGSTLISQMVATHPAATVVSESSAVTAVLAMLEVPEAERIRLLQQVVRALGRRPASCETHYVIKFKSWNLLHVSLIKRAFPDVPCLFIYRDPVEVLVSLVQDPPPSRVPVETLSGDATAGEQAQAVRYAQALQSFMQHALASATAKDVLVNYANLPACVPDLMQRYWGFSLAGSDTTRMMEHARYYARGGKQDQLFVLDTARKQAEASAEIRRVDAEYTRSLYERLSAHPQAYHLLPR